MFEEPDRNYKYGEYIINQMRAYGLPVERTLDKTQCDVYLFDTVLATGRRDWNVELKRMARYAATGATLTVSADLRKNNDNDASFGEILPRGDEAAIYHNMQRQALDSGKYLSVTTLDFHHDRGIYPVTESKLNQEQTVALADEMVRVWTDLSKTPASETKRPTASQQNGAKRRAKETKQDGRQHSMATAKRRLKQGKPINVSLVDRAILANLTSKFEDEETIKPLVAAARLRAAQQTYAAQLQQLRRAHYTPDQFSDETLLRLLIKYNGDVMEAASAAGRLTTKYNWDSMQIANAVVEGEFE